MEIPLVVTVSLCVIALSSIAVAIVFMFLVKALIANTESLKMLIDHLDGRLDTAMDSVQQSINDVNKITERVNDQMDRVENIVQNVQHTTKDARTSVHMVNATVVPMLANMHGIMGGIKKGVDVWRESGAPPQAGEPEHNEQSEH